MRKLTSIAAFCAIAALAFGTGWWVLGGLSPAEANTANAEKKRSSKREFTRHSLILGTVVDTVLYKGSMNSVTLEAKLEVNGVRNLVDICRNLPKVMEAILTTLARKGDETVDHASRLLMKSHNVPLRIATNDVFQRDMVRHVIMLPAHKKADHAIPRLVCMRAEQIVRKLGASPA